jgi:hypothetical protein
MTGEQRDRPAAASYQIRVRGHLGAAMRRAFPALHAETRGPDTLLQGVVDQAALHGVLARIEALGLELLEVRRLVGEPKTSRNHRTRDTGAPGRPVTPGDAHETERTGHGQRAQI